MGMDGGAVAGNRERVEGMMLQWMEGRIATW